jgi:hypothetical protein
MGAHDSYCTYKESDREKVKKAFLSAQDDARIEDGDGGYTGTIATMRGGIGQWYDKKFPTQQEAVAFMLDHHDKWEPATAVSYLLPKAPTETQKKRIEEARARIKDAEDHANELNKKLRETFKARTSKFLGCASCGSKLNHEKLVILTQHTRILCPLCQTSLLSETDLSRIAAAKTKVEERQKVLAELQKPDTGTEYGWVVGGWAAS